MDHHEDLDIMPGLWRDGDALEIIFICICLAEDRLRDAKIRQITAFLRSTRPNQYGPATPAQIDRVYRLLERKRGLHGNPSRTLARLGHNHPRILAIQETLAEWTDRFQRKTGIDEPGINIEWGTAEEDGRERGREQRDQDERDRGERDRGERDREEEERDGLRRKRDRLADDNRRLRADIRPLQSENQRVRDHNRRGQERDRGDVNLRDLRREIERLENDNRWLRDEVEHLVRGNARMYSPVRPGRGQDTGSGRREIELARAFEDAFNDMRVLEGRANWPEELRGQSDYGGRLREKELLALLQRVVEERRGSEERWRKQAWWQQMQDAYTKAYDKQRWNDLYRMLILANMNNKQIGGRWKEGLPLGLQHMGPSPLAPLSVRPLPLGSPPLQINGPNRRNHSVNQKQPHLLEPGRKRSVGVGPRIAMHVLKHW